MTPSGAQHDRFPLGFSSFQDLPFDERQRLNPTGLIMTRQASTLVNDLTITRLEFIPLVMPLPKVFRGSYYSMSHRCTIITRLYTAGGIIGECYNGDEYETQAEVLTILRDEIAPRLIGLSAAAPEVCWEAALPPTFNILRDRHLALSAQACVDSAVWDAFGKAVGQPLYRLWGGAKQELRVIAIAGYYEDGKTLDDYASEMRALREAGLGGCKFKVGGRSPEEDAARVRAARSSVDSEFRICVDANQGWDLADAVRFGRLAADIELMWFEEPCRWFNDRRAMADVRRITGIPVTAGQSELSRSGCRDLMMDGAIDFCNFDASWCGGPSEWRRVAGMATAFGVTMAHHEEPQVSAHLLASIPHSACLEVFHPDRDPLFYELVENRNPFVNGFYKVPEGPGWGLKLNEAVIRKYRVAATEVQ
jgi:D-arabinonate dehydratase